MAYMLMILEPRGQRRARSPEDGHAVYQRMLDYSANLKGAGCADGDRVAEEQGGAFREA